MGSQGDICPPHWLWRSCDSQLTVFDRISCESWFMKQPFLTLCPLRFSDLQTVQDLFIHSYIIKTNICKQCLNFQLNGHQKQSFTTPMLGPTVNLIFRSTSIDRRGREKIRQNGWGLSIYGRPQRERNIWSFRVSVWFIIALGKFTNFSSFFWKMIKMLGKKQKLIFETYNILEKVLF